MKDLLHKLKIGSVTLDNNILLAPMAGVTDLPFRLLCREQGVGLVCMEMISAKAILYKNKIRKACLPSIRRRGLCLCSCLVQIRRF